MTQLDLAQVTKDERYFLTVGTTEHPDDRKARLELQLADAAHQRRKDWYTHMAMIGGLAVVVIVSGAVGLGVLGNAQPEERSKCLSVLTHTVTASLAYLSGRKALQKSE